ncbi:MAG: hypothetical protein ACLQJR_16910 [Stellaceae bacterium]
MTEGSLHQMSTRQAAGAIRPAKKQILRAHMTAMARRLYGPDQTSSQYRDMAVNILQARRRAAGR